MSGKRHERATAQPGMAISTDALLTDAAQDRLQIHAFAQRVANAVMSVPADQGSGKLQPSLPVVHVLIRL